MPQALAAVAVEVFEEKQEVYVHGTLVKVLVFAFLSEFGM
jgi:hypothetical protein